MVSERIVYKGDIVKPENKGIEISCRCECEGKHRYNISQHREYRNISLRNEASIVVWNKDKINKARDFAKEWKCKNGNTELKTEFFTYE